MSEEATTVPAPLPATFAAISATTPPPGTQPRSADASVKPWRRQRGMSNVLGVLFVPAIAVSVFTIVAVANRLTILDDVSGRRVGGDSLGRLRDADDVAAAAGLASLASTIVIGAVFIVWMWRAAMNNEALGRDTPRLGPGWAIGGWFIPLANLVIPVLVVQDLWRGSTARIARGDMRWRIADRSALVGWWWGAWVFSLLRGVTLGLDTQPSDEVDALRVSNWFSVLGGVSGVAAAILAILVVHAVTRRQEQTLETQQAAWAAARRE